MDVEDLALGLLTQGPKTFCLKDIPDKNVIMLVSSLKGVLNLLSNCS